MKVTEHIAHSKGETLFSFEIIPPVKGKSIQELYDNIDPLMEFKPPFIDVTTSREEYVYIDRDGLLDKKLTRMRPGTLGICASIKHKYDVDAIPHVLCGGFTKEETEYLLVDCHYLGIDNVMALRGDAMREEKYFEPTKGGHHFASDLVEQIQQLNRGNYLHEVIESDNCADFCIGVAGYPEKHMEAPSLQSDLKRLKHKVDLGADYVVTQMFFDNSKFFEFVEAARAIGLSHAKIIFKHILPNSLGPIITFSPFVIAGGISGLAALDYLGFGLAPPTPSWGELLSQAQEFRYAWWLVLYPSLALFVVILLGVFIGEGVRAAFDPRVNSRFES